MKRLLALAIREDWVGDWHTVRGDEQSVIAHPVLEGEEVLLEVERASGIEELALGPGMNQIAVDGWRRYRVVKKCSAAAAPGYTTVELFTHGKTHRQDRDAKD